MNYQKLLEQIAKKYNTTSNEVEREMRKALEKAGYNIEPALFITLVTKKAKKTIYRN